MCIALNIMFMFFFFASPLDILHVILSTFEAVIMNVYVDKDVMCVRMSTFYDL